VFQVTQLAPQVVKAGRVVLLNPGEIAARDHFEVTKKQWSDNLDQMQTLMDGAIDTQMFMAASGNKPIPPVVTNRTSNQRSFYQAV